MTKHTPTPWTCEGEVDGRHHAVAIMAEGARPAHPLIAQMLFGLGRVEKETALANAAFIVRAVNSHEALVEACKEAIVMAEILCWHTATQSPALKSRYNKLVEALNKAEGK